MQKAIGHRGIGRAFGMCLAVLAAWAGPGEAARAQPPAPRPAESPSSVEERLRRLEAVNTQLLERLDRDREESDRRYRELEGRYIELKRRVGEPGPRSRGYARRAQAREPRRGRGRRGGRARLASRPAG